MSYLPHLDLQLRSPRIRPAQGIPAVLRFPDGQTTAGKLDTISLTGGLLNLDCHLAKGTRGKLMFITQTGPVLGAAEMLPPTPQGKQPFRFVALHEPDQRRLGAAIQQLLGVAPAAILGRESRVQSLEGPRIADREQAWIEKYRAAVANPKPKRRIVRTVLAALFLTTACLGGALYFFGVSALR